MYKYNDLKALIVGYQESCQIDMRQCKTRQSKHCGFSIIFLIIQVKVNGQVGQGGEDGLVWSGLCQKDSRDDFDSEYTGLGGSPDD